MEKAKTEQYYIVNKFGDTFNLYRESETQTNTCFVVADGIDEDTGDLAKSEKGIFTSLYSKSDSVQGKLSLDVYIFGDEKRDELVSFIYRNLDLVKVYKRKLFYGQHKVAYCYCELKGESIKRAKQSNDFKGELNFEKLTEWFHEEEYPISRKETTQNYIAFNKKFNGMRLSNLNTNDRLDVLANKTNGNLAPFFKITLYGKGINPKITLTQKGIKQVIFWEDTRLEENDVLSVVNILTIPNGDGIKHQLNGLNYFGKNKLQNKAIYSELVKDEEFEDTEFVSFFHSLDLSYKIQIENVSRALVTVVHRFIKW